MSVFLQWWDGTILQPSTVIGCSIHKGREDYCVKSAMPFRRSISPSVDYFGWEFLTSISLLPCKLQLVHSEQKMNTKLERLPVAQKLMVCDIAHLVTLCLQRMFYNQGCLPVQLASSNTHFPYVAISSSHHQATPLLHTLSLELFLFDVHACF